MSNKVLISLLVILLLFMVGLTVGFFLIWNKLSVAEAMVNGAGTNDNQSQPANEALGAIYSLEPFIINLADEGGKRYLRVTIDLELKNESVSEEIKKRLPEMRDRILMILPSKRFEDIKTVEGKALLRNEIIAKLNSLFGGENIANLFFTEFVVQ